MFPTRSFLILLLFLHQSTALHSFSRRASLSRSALSSSRHHFRHIRRAPGYSRPSRPIRRRSIADDQDLPPQSLEESSVGSIPSRRPSIDLRDQELTADQALQDAQLEAQQLWERYVAPIQGEDPNLYPEVDDGDREDDDAHQSELYNDDGDDHGDDDGDDDDDDDDQQKSPPHSTSLNSNDYQQPQHHESNYGKTSLDSSSTVIPHDDHKKDADAQEKKKSEDEAKKDREAAAQAEKDKEAAAQTEKDNEATAQAEKDKEAAAKAEKDKEAAAEAEKDKEAAAQAEKDKEAAAQAEKDKEAAAQAEKDKEAAAQAEKDKEAAAQAEKDKEAAAQPKKTHQDLNSGSNVQKNPATPVVTGTDSNPNAKGSNDDDSYASPPSSSADHHTGDATFYDPGLGACGLTNVSTDYIVAVSHLLYDSFPSQGGNPNTNQICGKKIQANYQGKSVEVTVVDRCEGCDKYSLDFTITAFEKLGKKDEGRLHGMTWTFI